MLFCFSLNVVDIWHVLYFAHIPMFRVSHKGLEEPITVTKGDINFSKNCFSIEESSLFDEWGLQANSEKI